VVPSRFALVFTMTLLVMSVLLWALYQANPLALLSAEGLGTSTKLAVGGTTAETADSPIPIQRPSSETSQSSHPSGSAETAEESAQAKTRENSAVPQRQDGGPEAPADKPENAGRSDQPLSRPDVAGNPREPDEHPEWRSSIPEPAQRSGSAKTADESAQTETRENSVVPRTRDGDEPIPGGQSQHRARSKPVFPSTGLSPSGSGGPNAPADKPENARRSDQPLSEADVAGNSREPYEHPESRSSIPEPAQRSGSAKTADESAQTKTRENSVVPQRRDGDEPIPGGQPQNRTLANSGTERPAPRSEPVFPSTGLSPSGSGGPKAPAEKPENAPQSNQAFSTPDVARNPHKPYENPESRSNIPQSAEKADPHCPTRESSDSRSIRAECNSNKKIAKHHQKRKGASSRIQTIDIYAGGAHIIIICNLRSQRGAREGC
jgi:hypothetical protein